MPRPSSVDAQQCNTTFDRSLPYSAGDPALAIFRGKGMTFMTDGVGATASAVAKVKLPGSDHANLAEMNVNLADAISTRDDPSRETVESFMTQRNSSKAEAAPGAGDKKDPNGEYHSKIKEYYDKGEDKLGTDVRPPSTEDKAIVETAAYNNLIRKQKQEDTKSFAAVLVNGLKEFAKPMVSFGSWVQSIIGGEKPSPSGRIVHEGGMVSYNALQPNSDGTLVGIDELSVGEKEALGIPPRAIFEIFYVNLSTNQSIRADKVDTKDGKLPPMYEAYEKRAYGGWA